MRCSNLLRHRQGFEMGIKDCVLTKTKQVFFLFTESRISVSFASRVKKSCTSS